MWIVSSAKKAETATEHVLQADKFYTAIMVVAAKANSSTTFMPQKKQRKDEIYHVSHKEQTK